ncbi:blaR1 peptidase M56 family protein [Lacinutrix sp. WUR7]|uniref:M56 family metallopeptidase n=1 Tax=Lacinutrix sp. WUR7 TaxID=2653681 RepID=UPI00193CD51E|nr:M56 family metallopeptidase [Lacinutrix sp. WUR7]QRM88333.1 blaR1 peptidase M56 family protein [Lacinutrix sp. WUR7]
MLHYIIQTIAFQCFFLLLYDVFLKRETFFNWNRCYLLGTAFLSLIIPFIKIESLKTVVPKNYMIWLPEVVLGNQNNTLIQQEIPVVILSNIESVWTWTHLMYLGITISSMFFVYKIFKIMYLILTNPKRKKGNITLISLLNKEDAFSFFHYVFIGNSIPQKERETILIHEMVHVQQKHTLDLLFFEVLRILFWFNPLVYMYQNRIASLHEFIADEKSIKQQSKKAYYENLLGQVFQVKQISFINPFFKQSLIKKRIVMLNKSKSKKTNLVKYVFLLPIIAGMLVYTSCSQEENAVNTDQDFDQVVEKFRNQLQTENSTLSKEERIELAEYIIDELKANVEDNGKTSSGSITASSFNSSDEVSFSEIENVPVFPGCEGEIDNKERKKCMALEISKFVNQNFNVNLANDLGLEAGKHRISVQFKVDEKGNVVEVKARAPHAKLEQEAIRIVSLLPKMKPGMHLGKAVTVPYGFPIQFQIKE